jgi:hypothetical protein
LRRWVEKGKKRIDETYEKAGALSSILPALIDKTDE